MQNVSLPSSPWWRSVLSFKSSSTQGRASALALGSPFLLSMVLSAFLKIHTIKMQTSATKTGVRNGMAVRQTPNGAHLPTPAPGFKPPGSGQRRAVPGAGRERCVGREQSELSDSVRICQGAKLTACAFWVCCGLVMRRCPRCYIDCVHNQYILRQ